mmetsp:Transcript_88341/g.245192  ORF Transcript_88341/g.245192 Transcript_88341/m.245192 type:complete len:260 (+) Transcript_88341:313-1092(+)
MDGGMGGARDTVSVRSAFWDPKCNSKGFLQPADSSASFTDSPRSPARCAWCRPLPVCTPILQGAQRYSFRTCEAATWRLRCAAAPSLVPASPPTNAWRSDPKPLARIWDSLEFAVLSSSGAASANVFAPCSRSSSTASSDSSEEQSSTVFISAFAWFTSAFAVSSSFIRSRCAWVLVVEAAGSAPAAASSAVLPCRTKLFTSARSRNSAEAASRHSSCCSLATRYSSAEAKTRWTNELSSSYLGWACGGGSLEPTPSVR